MELESRRGPRRWRGCPYFNRQFSDPQYGSALNVSNVTVVGYDGTGIFNNSGTHTTGALYLGFNAGYGEYNLNAGGTLNVNAWAGLILGGKNYNPGTGTGVFNQYGGTAN